MAIILSNQWLAKRRPYWDRLNWLLNQATQGGVHRLSRAELRETALLYRQAASDLSTLRQDSTARAYAELVNQLLARAHHIIYSSRRKGFMKIFYFLRDDYPAVVQRRFRYVLLSLIILLAGGALGSVLTLARPQFMRHMLGPQMVDTIEHHKMWTDSIVGLEPEASSAIMTNNITVCFMAFAGGIVFGALSERWGRKRAIVAAALLAIPVIPLYAYGHSALVLGLGAVLMQFMVQGAWGVVPAYLTELSPAAIRATAPGLAYQLGGLITSWNGKGQALAAERWGNYPAVLAISVAVIALALAAIASQGRDPKGADLTES